MTSRNALRAGLIGIALASVTACAGGAPGAGGDSATHEDDATSRGKMQLVVTVDWEGRDLEEANLVAMERLRARFPDVKLVHFLNAAYYTKQDADAADVTARIGRVLAPGDEKGLHIHGWKRLFEASGVAFRAEPTLWGTSLDANGAECASDCGHEVPISLYTTEELRKVVRFSRDTLADNGFGQASSFRCGAWMTKTTVRDAIAAEGMTHEHSAVPTVFLQPKLANVPLYGWLSELWEGTTSASQPYLMPTSSASLVEVPDNGALADYVTADDMVGTFETNKTAYLANRRRNTVVSIGFHQETAARYLPELEAALERIYATATAERLPLESVTSEAIARPAP